MSEHLCDEATVLQQLAKKASIDMHTNIATALLGHVRARELDRFFEVEDQLASQSVGTSVTQMEELLADKQKGTLLDKTRALMVLYLTKPSIGGGASGALQGLLDILHAQHADTAGFSFLRRLPAVQAAAAAVPAVATGPPVPPGAASVLMGGMLGGIAKKAAKKGQGLLAEGMSNIKSVVVSKKDLPLCQVLEALMDQKPSGPNESFIYLDPKTPAGETDVPRIRSPYRRAITFVVGGGSHVEMQAVSTWARSHGNRHVTYGSTDMVSPEHFLSELTHLGQELQGGGASSGMIDLS